MFFDLLAALRVAYFEARARDDGAAMEAVARAISYASAGHRDLAMQVARACGLAFAQ